MSIIEGGLVGHGDPAYDLFGRRVYDRQVVCGRAPVPVDVELQLRVGRHGWLVASRVRWPPVGNRTDGPEEGDAVRKRMVPR